MQIIIPMAGAGKRFAQVGYDRPKPLIEFFGKTMIQHVLENLGLNNDYTLCVLQDHYDNYKQIFDNLKTMVKTLNIVFVDQVTRGAAETCLLAKDYIRLNDPLMIANCDQMQYYWNDTDLDDALSPPHIDGIIFTFFKDTTAYSYVELDENNIAIRTAEKEVISTHATTGLYVWKRSRDFFSAAEDMINNDIRSNNEFYVCPVYNINIQNGLKIGVYIPKEHWPIGTPEDLEIYIKHVESNSISAEKTAH